MSATPLYSGKVRDIYAVGDDRLLMVTSDRISAFDVVMAEPIPDKGRVRTAMTAFWSEQLADVPPPPPPAPPPRGPAPRRPPPPPPRGPGSCSATRPTC